MADRSAELDDEVLAFLAERARRTAEEFGGVPAGEAPLLAWGETAEYRPVTADGRPRIFVARGDPDWWRIRYQIAHEVFHWLCTPPRTFHWAHELFAVEMAIRAMEEIGEADYARRSAESLTADAALLPLGAMLVTTLAPGYPLGLYGRAWLTGRRLGDAVGWELLKPLARSFRADGRPDVAGWMRSLREDEQARVESLLGPPSPAWV